MNAVDGSRRRMYPGGDGGEGDAGAGVYPSSSTGRTHLCSEFRFFFRETQSSTTNFDFD